MCFRATRNPEQEGTSDRVMTSAADPIYGEIRDRLAGAGEQIAVLRRQGR